MPDFGIFRGFNEKLFGDKLYAGQLPTLLGLIGSKNFGFVGLLDTYKGAAAAYSLRQLKSGVTNAIEVRIDTTGQPTYDIGFVDGELDTATLEGYCTGGLDAYVTTWYDQSGNGNDATQTTAASQPKIYDSASGVIEDNGKPSLEFNNKLLQSNSLFQCNYISYVSSDSPNSLSQRFDPTEQQYNWGLSELIGQKSVVIYNPSFSYYSTVDAYSNIQSLHTIQSQDVELFKNGSSILDTNQNVVLGASPNTEKLNIGAYGENGNYTYFNGKFQEIIIYNSDQSSNRSGIETNINDFYSIY